MFDFWSWFQPINNFFYGSWGSSTITLTGHYSYKDMGWGDDQVTVKGTIDHILMGSGNDKLFLEKTAGNVWMGSGNDEVTISHKVNLVDGGSGYDTAHFTYKATEVDIKVDWMGRVVLSNKLTGEQTTLSSIEKYSFKGGSYTHAEMVAHTKPESMMVADGTGMAFVNDDDPSVSVVWSRALHTAIADSDTAQGPTIAARAMAMVHTAIYDAWASYDAKAARVSLDQDGNNAAMEARAVHTTANMEKAMNFAAYKVLINLYPDMKATFDEIMEKRYGLNPNGDGSLASAIGHDAAKDLLASRLHDGANQAGDYRDTTGYTPVNTDSDHITVIDRWTPDRVATNDQMFLTPQWGKVNGFAIPKTGGENDFSNLTPAKPKAFLTEAYADSKVNLATGQITLSADVTVKGVTYHAGQTIEISKALIGTVINAGFVAQAQEVVDISANLTDKQKMIAEFWEDGGGTSYPPGSAMTLAEYVSARDNNDTGTDAKLFMAVANAQLDSSIAAWHAKVTTDYARPVKVIQELGKLGLIGTPGVDEITGERGHVIRAWAGPEHGVKTILAANFVSYQQPGGDPSPPFAEYVSGHSTFSASAAKVLALMTSSDHLGVSVTIPAGSSRFEPNTPNEEVTLHWDTFSQTAQESGGSRLYGGIHFSDGNVNGLALGSQIGTDVFEFAQAHFNGTAGDEIA